MLRPIATQYIVPLNKDDGRVIFNKLRVIVEVRDESAGVYLAIRGVNEEPNIGVGERADEFYLQSVGEIEQFANCLKSILQQADGD